MSLRLYVFDQLALPFRLVAEQVMNVPEAGQRVNSSCFKIVLALDGKCHHAFSGEEAKLFQKGDALIVPRITNQLYSPLSRSENCRLQNMVILLQNALPEISRSLPASDNLQVQQLLEKYFSRNLHCENIINAAMLDIIGQIRREAELLSTGYEWKVSALCVQLLIEMMRQIEPAVGHNITNGRTLRGYHLVNHAKEYLSKNLTNQLSLDETARYLGISAAHLSRTFKKITGEALSAYLRRMRLEKAKSLLLGSDKNINQIAAECGFGSTELFCRNFKIYTGTQPSVYREKYFYEI